MTALIAGAGAGAGKASLSHPLSHPLSDDSGQAKATHSLRCTDLLPFAISGTLSQEAHTDPAGGGAGSPESILQISKSRLSQPVQG